MSGDEWPTPGRTYPQVSALAHAARPEVEAMPMGWLTETGYKPRRNLDVAGGLVVWWCRCCDTCLAHGKSAFCEPHRTAYNKQRRRLRDEARSDMKIPRSTIRQLHRLVDIVETTRLARADRQHLLRQTGLPEDQRAEIEEQWKAAVGEHNVALRSLVLLVKRELPLGGEPAVSFAYLDDDH